MADISKTVAIIFEGEDRTSGALAKIEGSLGGVKTGAKGAADGMTQLEDSAGKVGGSSSKIDGLATAIKGLAIAAVVKEFIDANVAVERFQLSMTATTGSATLAAKEFDYIRGVSNRLGLELVSTAEAFPVDFLSLTNEITDLTGQGFDLVKPPAASPPTPA